MTEKTIHSPGVMVQPKLKFLISWMSSIHVLLVTKVDDWNADTSLLTSEMYRRCNWKEKTFVKLKD